MGQKTKDVTFFGVEILLPRWRGIKGEDSQFEYDILSGELVLQETMRERFRGRILQFFIFNFLLLILNS